MTKQQLPHTCSTPAEAVALGTAGGAAGRAAQRFQQENLGRPLMRARQREACDRVVCHQRLKDGLAGFQSDLKATG